MADDQKLAEWLRDLEERSFDDADKHHSRDKDYYNWLDECLLYFASAIARECIRLGDADAIRQRFGIEKE